MPVFKWTAAKEKAALLLSRDELSDELIAEAAGVSRRALVNWKSDPAFRGRIDAHVAEFRRRVKARGIAVLENRLDALQDRWERMRRVIDGRAADAAMADVPGGKTGLLVHNVKSVGHGEDAERVDVYEVDTGLLKELREHERQAAQELGQWTNKTDLTTGGKPMDAAPTAHEVMRRVLDAPGALEAMGALADAMAAADDEAKKPEAAAATKEG